MGVILKVKDLRVTFPLDGEEVAAVDGISFSLNQGKVLGIVGESGCGKTLTALSLLQLIDDPGRIASGQALYYGDVPESLSPPPSPEKKPSSDETDVEKTPLPPDAASSDEEELTPIYGPPKISPSDHTASLITWEQEPVGGIDLYKLNQDEIRKIRGNKIAMIFQEPMTSLNPVFTVGDQIMESIRTHRDFSKSDARDLAIDMLRKVRIPDAHQRIRDYPHQMSGGMRQRVMIAMALACQPDILIADEPTTALDVTIQAQILDLIQELIDEFHMSVLLITHDLGVVAQVCDDVLVMYAGLEAEQAPVDRIFNRPKHPYTIGLLNSIPQLFEPMGGKLATIGGLVPSLGEMPEGCRFAGRCPRMVGACQRKIPSMKYVGEGQYLRCLNY